MLEYVGPIEKLTLENTYFRQVLFTGKHSQLVLMCLGPGKTSATRCTRTSTNSSASSRGRPIRLRRKQERGAGR